MTLSFSIANEAISNWHKKHGRIWRIKHGYLRDQKTVENNFETLDRTELKKHKFIIFVLDAPIVVA